jgi:hypothetical protein
MVNKSSNSLVHIVFHKQDAQDCSKVKSNVLNFKTSTTKKKKNSNNDNNCPTSEFLKKKKQKTDNDTHNGDKKFYEESYEKPQPYLPSPVSEPESMSKVGRLTPVSSKSMGYPMLPQISRPQNVITPAPSHSSATSAGAKNTHTYFDKAELTPACARDLESTCIKIKRSQQAAQMASRMINMKIASEGATPKTLHPNHILLLPSTGDASGKIEPENHKLIQASPATLGRVERVKASLELHYDMIAAYQGSNSFAMICPDKNEQDDTGNFEQRGVYNPVRIIRNRRTRDALELPAVRTQAAQLARQQMQSRLLCYAKSPWTIDAYEMVIDYTWGCQLSQLGEQEKKASQPPKSEQPKITSGAQVFPRKASVSLDPLKKIATTTSQFLPEKSLADSDFHLERQNTQLQQNFIKGGRRKSKSSSTLPDLIRPSTIHTASINGQRSFSSSAVTLASAPTTPTRTGAKPASASEGSKMTPLSSRTSGQTSVLTSSPLRSDAMTLTVNKSPCAVLSTDHEPALLPPRTYQAKSSQSTLLRKTCTRRLAEYKLYETVYITQHQHNQQQLDRVAPPTQGDASSKACANRIYADLSKTFSYMNRVLLPKAHTVQKANETEVQLLRRTRLSKLSTRIDILLADCDQTNNRLSTTLNLEVKALTEKMDALDRHVSCKMHIKWCLWAIIYSLLEYIVVSIMWIAWGLVSAFMAGKDSVLIITRTIRWLLWC